MGWTSGQSGWAGRFLCGGLLTACLLLPETVSAQGETDQVFSEPNPWVTPASHTQGDVGYATMSPPGLGAVHAGEGLYAVDPGVAFQPSAPYPTAQTAIPGTWYQGRDGTLTSRVPGYDDWLEPSPFEKFVKQAISNSTFRLEYLNWRIGDPGHQLLGSATLNTSNPREFFVVEGGLARVADIFPVRFNDIDGIRGTLNIPFKEGVLETSAFALEQASDEVIPQELPAVGDGIFIATTTTFNGELTDAVRVYDVRFEARYTSDVWALESLFVFDREQHTNGFHADPVAGLQFFSLQEQLQQVGEVSAQAAGGTGFVTLIDSDSHNNIYGAKLGFRTELRHDWFVLGAQPTITAGLNSYRARVTSDQFVGPDDPKFVTESEETVFSPLGELKLYARIHVREHFFFTIGYDAIWAWNVARPHEQIVYDTNAEMGTPVSSNIHVREDLDDILFQGLSVGGEIHFH